MRQHTFPCLLLVFAGSALASCDLTGTYVRVQEGLLPATLELSRTEGGLRLALDAYGPRMFDGNPTVGTLEGVVKVASRQSTCTALFTSPEDECSLKMKRARGGVSVVQVGSCLTFGANVDASGFYRESSRP